MVVVGQDGLVANVGQVPRPDSRCWASTPTPAATPASWSGTARADAPTLLPAALDQRRADELTMVEAVADDTQRLVALNEIYLGAAGHQTARYRLGLEGDGGVVEAQASSGVLVGTGTGATGWLRSVWQERGSALRLPAPRRTASCGSSARHGRPRRPARPWSPASSPASARLRLTVESERLIAFGDGMEGDAVELTWGQTVRVGVCGERLRLVG